MPRHKRWRPYVDDSERPVGLSLGRHLSAGPSSPVLIAVGPQGADQSSDDGRPGHRSMAQPACIRFRSRSAATWMGRRRERPHHAARLLTTCWPIRLLTYSPIGLFAYWPIGLLYFHRDSLRRLR